MMTHNFSDEDFRILSSLAIDLHTDHLFFKTIRIYDEKENYWSIEGRFTHDEDQFDTYYDSFHLDCGRENEPETYQMSWCIMRDGKFKQRPISCPLVVVHYFEELCKKEHANLN